MNERQQAFLDLYRRFESVLREQGLDYRTVSELQSSDEKRNRMNYLRTMRNYLTHNADASFVCVETCHLQYLEDLLSQQVKHGNIVKKSMIPISRCGCLPTDSLSQVLNRMVRHSLPAVALLRPSGSTEQVRFFGYFLLPDLVRVYLQDSDGLVAQVSVRNAVKETHVCSGDCLQSVLDEQLLKDKQRASRVLVTEDGTIKGKVLGVYFPDYVKYLS